MAENKNSSEVINLEVIIKLLWAKKVHLSKVVGITFVLSAALILCVPRYYNSEIKLAPEMDASFADGAIGNLASSFGFDLGTMATSDAISPELYPELLQTNDFIVQLFPIAVESYDGEIKTDYYTYITKHQKYAWWTHVIHWIKRLFPQKKDVGGAAAGGGINPLNLSRTQQDVVTIIGSNIRCSIDRKTSLITVKVKDQDRKICATVADSLRLKLQAFITDYRTSKARIDVDYYEKLVKESKAEYDEARRRYAGYADSHTDASLTRIRAAIDDLESDMQLKFNTYNAMTSQLQAARAKLQQRTPAFTLLEGAAVPVKPAGPKRMIFVAMMMMMAFGIAGARIIYKNKNKVVG
ncbi:MAG: chain-length determining protein [Prevotella sp.]|nr:chain-length determining protein [Prevotella sp.]